MPVRSPALPTVRYGDAALADLLPSVLTALGARGERNPLGLPDLQRIVVLLVDGLGWQALRRHADLAPFLTGLAGRPLTAGFPTTTVVSLVSLGTGLPSGQHGLTGYSSYVPEVGAAVNWLSWAPIGGGADLRERLVPEVVQPAETALERAAADGITVTVVSPRQFLGSGLTRAALRGGEYAGTVTFGDVIVNVAAAAARGSRSLVYCYLHELDLVGHVRGVESDAWLAQLELVDHMAAALAARLPPQVTLLITADHGMVTVPEENKIDFDASTALQGGVLALAGEPRARYVHVQPGAAAEVRAAWQEQLGARMWILSRAEAVAAGWFGPTVTPTAAERVGDVIAVAHTPAAVVRRRTESQVSALPGQHGALSDEELLVPLLRYDS